MLCQSHTLQDTLDIQLDRGFTRVLKWTGRSDPSRTGP
jgi:hypothetical protein